MAKHLNDYVIEQQKSFSEEPFNPLDSLILSSISYFNLEYAHTQKVKDAPQVLLSELIEQSDNEALVKEIWLEYSTRTPEFLKGLIESKRYAGTRLGFYVNEVSEEKEMQFAAVSLILPDDTTYVSFRGTDLSYSGWKEDFNLAYKKVVKSQEYAAAYVEHVSASLASPLILGGHSKGGNLAEYAALVVKEDVYNRICKVFNHDGPAFLTAPSDRFTSTVYNFKLHKTTPASSPIGMILEERTNYCVVKSDGFLVLQHEPFSWLIEDNDFIYKDKSSWENALFGAAFNSMIRQSSPKDKEKLVDTLYDLFASTKTNSWAEYSSNILANSQHIVSEGLDLDEETKDLFNEFIQKFLRALKDEVFK